MSENEIIRSFKLFEGLDERELAYSLAFFKAERGCYAKGESLNRTDEPMPYFGLVLSGVVHVLTYDFNGFPMLMAGVESGRTFGESLNFLGIPAHVYITAEEDTVILRMKTDALKNRAAGSAREEALEHKLSNRFTSILAAKTLEMNDRIQVLSKITIRDKLITFFSQCEQRYGVSFTLPFDRDRMAVYLGVNRSALSRELSAMRAEGIIKFSKNRFTLTKSLDGGL